VTSTRIVTLAPSVSGGRMSEQWAQQQVEKFSFSFDQADVDKNGSLSFTEVFNILKSVGFNGSEKEAQFIFGHLDRNHDDKISKFEFTAAMNNLPRVNLKVFVLRRAFKTLDKDGSGFLTRQEILEATVRDCGLDIAAEKISDLLLYLIKEDDDNKVSFEEFLHVFGIEHVGNAMQVIFAKLDTDKSGFLTRDEILAATHRESELALTKDKISDLLISWVKDSPTNKINYQEFVQIWMKQKERK